MSDIGPFYSGNLQGAPGRRPFFRRAVLVFCLGAGLLFLVTLPWVPELQEHNPSTSSFLQLREKQAAQHGQHLKSVMVWRDLGHISPLLIHAVLLAEDDRFYQHHGFDFDEILIAVQRDWEKKRYVYGGSTITQQLARTLYLSPKKSLIRKAREAAITLWMEACLRKKRILEIYLNVVEWGPGIYGAEAASQYYYQTSSEALTADQAVALASILPSPRRWSPSSEKAFMAARRTRLYQRMQAAGYIPAAPEPDFGMIMLPAVPDPDALQVPENLTPAPEN